MSIRGDDRTACCQSGLLLSGANQTDLMLRGFEMKSEKDVDQRRHPHRMSPAGRSCDSEVYCPRRRIHPGIASPRLATSPDSVGKRPRNEYLRGAWSWAILTGFVGPGRASGYERRKPKRYCCEFELTPRTDYKLNRYIPANLPLPFTGWTMKLSNLTAVVSIFAVVGVTISGTVQAAEKNDFIPATDFFRIPENITLDLCSGVSVNSQGHVYLAHRGRNPVICFDSSGRYLRSWGDKFIGSAHGLRVDPDDNVWVTDIDKHVVLKFSPTGKLLLRIGRPGNAGLANDQFNKPADVAFDAKGQIYVADGYGNSRVMKFSPDGRFLSSWGSPGTGPGEFNLPHTIVVAADGRIIVGDRLNNRIQVFNADGTHLEIWDGFTPFGLDFDGDGVLWLADGKNHKLLQLDHSGAVLQSWGEPGRGPGQFDVPHMLAADEAGNLYIAEILNRRLQKFTRTP